MVENLVQRNFHTRNPVQRVKHTENVNAVLRGLLHEFANHVVGIVLVAHRIRAAQQHLECDVGDKLTQHFQTTPRRFLQEAIRRIERCTAPHFQRERVFLVQRNRGGNLHHVDGPHARGHKGLMRIAHGGIGDKQFLLVKHPFRHVLGAVLVKHLLGAAQRSNGLFRNLGVRGHVEVRLLAMRLVDHHVANVVEHLDFAVNHRANGRKLGIGLNEARVAVARNERGVIEHVQNERRVRFDALDLGFFQRTNSLATGIVKAVSVSRHLYQQAVVIRRNGGTGEAVTAVQANAIARSSAVQLQKARVGNEAHGRIFRSNAALNSITAHGNAFLRRNVNLIGVKRIALRNKNLVLHDVDARNAFGHGVLYLNARIHLNEVMVAVFVQQELHGTRAAIVHEARDFQSVFADRLALLIGQAQRRRELDNFLMAALNGTVALKKMHDVAVFVAQNLNFNVLGVLDVFLNEDVIVAERFCRFALCGVIFVEQVGLVAHNAHAASAAACSCLQNNGITAFVCEIDSFLVALDGFLDTRNGGDAHFIGNNFRLNLIAQLVHHVRSGANELNARAFACLREIGILGQETIARMNCVGAFRLCQGNDLIDGKIRGNGSLSLANLVRFIGLCSEQSSLILLRINRDGSDAQLFASANDSNRNLASVGNKDPLDVLNLAHDGLPFCLL